ncbi:hypothetical protein V6N13_050693 [Hibiscus sabdariffa]|uniref:Uncharacterized protein n=1 Tax=Hibiscus sabdariffa TaxID=183260 RepID=A0ABR2PI28_9ROSI
MDGCLAAEVAVNRKRNERRLLPVIGAVSARETTSDARRDVDDWSRLDGSGYRLSLRDRGDLRRQLSRATDSTGTDASRLQGRPKARLVRAKRFGLIPTDEDWYDGGWKGGDCRCNFSTKLCLLLRFDDRLHYGPI